MKLGPLAFEVQALLLGEALDRVALHHLIQLFEPFDRVRDRLPVGQRTAKPTVVHEVLRRAARRIGQRLLGLTLGADEQNAPALGHAIAHGLQRRIKQRYGLGQI